jgi:hypothetical protein
MDKTALLAQALRKAKTRQKPARKEDRQPGTGTNEAGPQVPTNRAPNHWPEDGDG